MENLEKLKKELNKLKAVVGMSTAITASAVTPVMAAAPAKNVSVESQNNLAAFIPGAITIAKVIDDAQKSSINSVATMIISGIKNYMAVEVVYGQINPDYTNNHQNGPITIDILKEMIDLGNYDVQIYSGEFKDSKLDNLSFSINGYKFDYKANKLALVSEPTTFDKTSTVISNMITGFDKAVKDLQTKFEIVTEVLDESSQMLESIIEDNKKSAAKSEATMIYSGLSNYLVIEQMHNMINPSAEATHQNCVITIDILKEIIDLGNNIVTVSGEIENYKIKSLKLNINGYDFHLEGSTLIADNENNIEYPGLEMDNDLFNACYNNFQYIEKPADTLNKYLNDEYGIIETLDRAYMTAFSAAKNDPAKFEAIKDWILDFMIDRTILRANGEIYTYSQISENLAMKDKLTLEFNQFKVLFNSVTDANEPHLLLEPLYQNPKYGYVNSYNEYYNENMVNSYNVEMEKINSNMIK